MKKFVLAMYLGIFTSTFAGCGGPGRSPPSPESPGPEISGDAQLKERLEYISTSGGMGSAFAGIKEMCEKNGNAELVTLANKLNACQDPNVAKII